MELVDLIGKISDAEDRHLIEESICALKAGVFRAAYIMAWIAAAESLKRRIGVLSQRDSVAGKVLGDIEDGERKHFAVDSKIIDGAFKLGLITDIEKTRLYHFFENRNIFGHPYNIAPSEEDVRAVICYVVGTVLAKAIKLKHSYIDERLNFLLNDVTYLDDDEEKIVWYAQEVARRVDDRLHAYLFKKYIEGIGVIWNDPEKRLLRKRGMQFCKAYLINVGVDKTITKGHWLDLMSKYPAILSWLASWESIFRQLDGVSQDSAILKNIEYAKSSSFRRLKRLKEMEKNCLLSESQSKHLKDALTHLSGYQLHQTEIAITDLYPYAKKMLDSYDFGTANSGSDFFFVYRIKGLKELSEEQQQDIGRSLCDAAIMNAHNTLNVVAGMVQGNIEVPVKVRVGYCARFFTKEVTEGVLQKEYLCRNSIKLLFLLPSTERIHIETTFTGVLDSVLKMDYGRAFVDVYECIRQKVLV